MDGLLYLKAEESFQVICREHFFGHKGVFARAAWAAVGGYDTTFSCAADLDFALRLSQRFDIAIVDRILLRSLVHGNNLSNNDELAASECARLFARMLRTARRPEDRQHLRQRIRKEWLDLAYGSARQAIGRAACIATCGLRAVRPRLSAWVIHDSKRCRRADTRGRLRSGGDDLDRGHGGVVLEVLFGLRADAARVRHRSPRWGRECGLPGPYLRPEANDPRWEAFFDRVFNGSLSNIWTRQDWRIAEGLSRWKPADRVTYRIARMCYHLRKLRAARYVVKEIRANLMLEWLDGHFPLRIVFVTRHPCAVIGLRLRVGWEANLGEIVTQAELMKDHLEPYREWICGARTPLQRAAVLWCVENLVPLKQRNRRNWVFLQLRGMPGRPGWDLRPDHPATRAEEDAGHGARARDSGQHPGTRGWPSETLAQPALGAGGGGSPRDLRAVRPRSMEGALCHWPKYPVRLIENSSRIRRPWPHLRELDE